jgi:hypothetical protein
LGQLNEDYGMGALRFFDLNQIVIIGVSQGNAGSISLVIVPGEIARPFLPLNVNRQDALAPPHPAAVVRRGYCGKLGNAADILGVHGDASIAGF